MAKKHSKSSKQWLKEHFSDPYVKQAQQLGYRSRAVFKLSELDDKDKLFKPGMTVVDLGAAPGGWSQYATDKLGGKGQIIALDLLPMDGLPGVEFIQGDFTAEEVLTQLTEALANKPINLVMSDMAPNSSGLVAVDQPRNMYLAELALDFALQHLATGGTFLSKLFMGEGFDEYLKLTRQYFGKVVVRKPKASRPRSREVYLLATEFKGKC